MTMTARLTGARAAAARWAAGVAVAVVVAWPDPAFAQGAATLYERAFAREQAARASAAPTAAALRAIARSYEAVVRRYPTSGYSDNALWQAAGVMKLAFEKWGDATDRQAAERLLTWLRREYPFSSLSRKVDAEIRALAAAEPPPAVEAPAPAGSPAAAAAPESPAAAPAPGAAAVIQDITQTALPRGERLTIALSREVVYDGERVENPDRVFVDFTNASAASALVQRAQRIGGSLITGVRIGRRTTGVTRVVLELTGSPRYSTFPLYDPFRLIVDVESDAPAAPPRPQSIPAASPKAEAPRAEPSKPAPVLTAAPPIRAAAEPPATAETAPPPPAPKPAPPAITSRGDYSLARQLGLGVSRIVIDAGHGGHDPGAQAHGVAEADLVLDVAHRLEKLLRQHEEIDVVLTRRSDEFIPLEERTAIANRERADLFLSIHANASRRSDARGVETYFLNFATNPDAENVAARENATSAQTMGTLPAILRAIALNNKLDESRELAAIVQTHLVRKLRAQNKGLRDLGVKQAPFVVLIGAQMPSILAEISFVTNKAEAALLKQPTYRQQIAQALYDGLMKYQTSLKKVTTAGQPQR
jgi:N-acetylmuramoyl-L-alanine amidase